MPLIYSGGRDETFGIRLVKPYVTWLGVPDATKLRGLPGPLTPYQLATDSKGGTDDYLGTPDVDHTATDNVHNHLLGKR